MITLHTPNGIVEVDPATVTDAKLIELGLTRAWANEQLADEAEAKAVRDLIDSLASNNALKKIGLYLRKKGYLP